VEQTGEDELQRRRPQSACTQRAVSVSCRVVSCRVVSCRVVRMRWCVCASWYR
jgi:hypothetical protein